MVQPHRIALLLVVGIRHSSLPHLKTSLRKKDTIYVIERIIDIDFDSLDRDVPPSFQFVDFTLSCVLSSSISLFSAQIFLALDFDNLGSFVQSLETYYPFL